MLSCPLCFTQEVTPFHQDKHRSYWGCGRCQLIFVPPEHHPSLEQERTTYDLHQNSPKDTRYRKFLSRLFDPLQNKLSPEAHGLDFGSGPGPTLSVMFTEAGYTMALYDPFFAPDHTALEKSYDFITTTEVLEHLHHPARELTTLWQCLKPGGLLGIMTKRVVNRAMFADWYYKNDLTHVSFYSEETFAWLAQQWQANCQCLGDDVVLFTKPV